MGSDIGSLGTLFLLSNINGVTKLGYLFLLLSPILLLLPRLLLKCIQLSGTLSHSTYVTTELMDTLYLRIIYCPHAKKP